MIISKKYQTITTVIQTIIKQYFCDTFMLFVLHVNVLLYIQLSGNPCHESFSTVSETRAPAIQSGAAMTVTCSYGFYGTQL
uniref:Uncharacterized protein n=1 Tax=Anguilla anguilla TaxID=7936 RepID=A0A0E9WHM3_ANGAN